MPTVTASEEQDSDFTQFASGYLLVAFNLVSWIINS